MSRVFVTGDNHGDLSIRKFNTDNFPIQKELTKDDIVFIAGDFGFPWRDDRHNNYWLDWLQSKNFTVAVVPGNHENYDLLETFPIVGWKGGRAYQLRESIFVLFRGDIFTIDGQKYFCMGGAESIDREFRTPHITWWKQEMPTYIECSRACDNLKAVNDEVDYIITHTCPSSLIPMLVDYKFPDWLTDFFEHLSMQVQFKKWYFGHFHRDVSFGPFECVYHKIAEIKRR